jgi:hypothetical protein
VHCTPWPVYQTSKPPINHTIKLPTQTHCPGTDIARAGEILGQHLPLATVIPLLSTQASSASVAAAGVAAGTATGSPPAALLSAVFALGMGGLCYGLKPAQIDGLNSVMVVLLCSAFVVRVSQLSCVHKRLAAPYATASTDQFSASNTLNLSESWVSSCAGNQQMLYPGFGLQSCLNTRTIKLCIQWKPTLTAPFAGSCRPTQLPL